MDIAAGDVVVYSKYGGTEIRVEGTDYLILRERDIHAVASERVDSGTGLYL